MNTFLLGPGFGIAGFPHQLRVTETVHRKGYRRLYILSIERERDRLRKIRCTRVRT